MKELKILSILAIIQVIAIIYKFYSDINLFILAIPSYICIIIIIRGFRIRKIHSKELERYNRILNFKDNE